MTTPDYSIKARLRCAPVQADLQAIDELDDLILECLKDHGDDAVSRILVKHRPKDVPGAPHLSKVKTFFEGAAEWSDRMGDNPFCRPEQAESIHMFGACGAVSFQWRSSDGLWGMPDFVSNLPPHSAAWKSAAKRVAQWCMQHRLPGSRSTVRRHSALLMAWGLLGAAAIGVAIALSLQDHMFWTAVLSAAGGLLLGVLSFECSLPVKKLRSRFMFSRTADNPYGDPPDGALSPDGLNADASAPPE